MKIALSIMGDERWMAGEVIVRNILLSVRELGLEDVRLALVTGSGANEDRIRTRYPAADEYLFYPIPKRFSPSWLGNMISMRLLQRDRILDEFLERNGVDVFFGACFAVKYPSVATLSWIPDFQHVHMPEMFGDDERATRDRNFEQTARLSTRVILLSRAVAKDFRDRIPQFSAQARVLSPITRVPDSVYASDPQGVATRYHLPTKFFYLPNQFWQHKNHQLIFEAIRNLKSRGTPVTVVCTGYPSDYRNINHFAMLWEKVSRWDIRDQIIYLGLVPYDDVIGLMRQCICVVNPSRFEGWGISIDEARSVGKRVLVSDIPTHREQDPPMATYFDLQKGADLEERMLEIWNSSAPGPDLELEDVARSGLPGRIRSYAEGFVAVAREAHRERRASA
jgi:glycosyltransferase involved in cell wall biosynthesis